MGQYLYTSLSSDDFESFARDLLEALDFRIIVPPSRGADGGKDLIVEENLGGIAGTTLKWLVSCKNFSISDSHVGHSKELNITDRVDAFHCDGFIGFYASGATTGLIDILEGLKSNPKRSFLYKIYDKREIEKLIDRLDVKTKQSILERYGIVKKVNPQARQLQLFNTEETLKEDSSNVDWRELSFEYPDRTIRVATVFSGIGAVEQALVRLKLKHKIIFACDIDEFVKQSYFANYGLEEDNWYSNIVEIQGEKYHKKIDLLVGGSPCQSFSMVGKRLGFEDTRGTLFYEFARVVKETQPKVFIYENVQGLLSHDNGRTWKVIQDVFLELGYTYYSKVLNSRDYNIPQNRNRIFVVGFKDSHHFDFPSSVPLERKMQDFLEDVVSSNYYLKEKGVKFVTRSKNRIKRYTQINGDIALCQKANQQFNWHGDFVFELREQAEFDEFIFDVNDVEEKYYLSEKIKTYVLAGGTKTFKTSTETDLEIARPLLQSMHKMHRAGVDNYVTHNKGRIRKLTPRECLRLMGFLDSFKIVVSDTQMYRQAGNSIVVDVIIALLKKMDITIFASED